MDNVNISIDGLVFERANYDAEGDVLYLTRGDDNQAVESVLTPEGHGVRSAADGTIIGVTIVNAKWLLERDGHLKITLPHEIRVEADELASAMA